MKPDKSEKRRRKMSERKSRGNRVGAGRWIFALVTAAAMVLVLSAPGWAQAQSPGSKSGQASAKPPAKAAAAPKGQSEGIKVHGHWTIDVKNPDGKVVTHREFENSLDPSAGSPLLSAMLAGEVSLGDWSVDLKGSGTGNSGGTIGIYQASSSEYQSCVSSALFNCSNNLTVTGPPITFVAGPGTGGFNGSSVTFTGSGTVPSGFAATIGEVHTIIYACLSSLTAAACAANTNVQTGTINGFPFTERALDGLNGDPAAVPVTPGQTVAVTVVISFM
jgi:hypothetical protein